MSATIGARVNGLRALFQRVRPVAGQHKTVAPARQEETAASAETADRASNGYFLLLMVIAVLCAFGLMMVLSSSSVEALRTYGSSWVFFKRQVVWLGLGGVAMWFATRTDYRHWRKYTTVLLAVSVALMFLVLVPGIGVEVSGSRRWLGAGPLRMQPSEIAKMAILIFSADLLAKRVDRMEVWQLTLRPVLIVFAVLAGLVMLQPDMGTTLIIGSMTAAVLFVAGAPARWIARIGIVAVGGAIVLAIVEPYRRARLLSFTDPFADASSGGYQVVQSLVGIGSGGILGVGLGESRAKWGFLPNAHTDFIFAIISEELGLVGGLAVVGLFVGFTLLGVRAAMHAPDRFGMLMAAGITAWVSMQAFLNIGAVIGILPVTGVPLPFLSQGGSSLIVLMIATGVLLNIARQGEPPEGKRKKTESKT